MMSDQLNTFERFESNEINKRLSLKLSGDFWITNNDDIKPDDTRYFAHWSYSM